MQIGGVAGVGLQAFVALCGKHQGLVQGCVGFVHVALAWSQFVQGAPPAVAFDIGGHSVL